MLYCTKYLSNVKGLETRNALHVGIFDKLVESTEIFPSAVETGNSTFVLTYNFEQIKGKQNGVFIITLNMLTCK
jgi:hypothetical protein